MDSPRHKIVVIGGGFGGLQAALHLVNEPVELTLVDRRNFHLFQPLTYQVATGALSPGEICYPLRAIFRRRPNLRVLMAEVSGFDLGSREVTLERAAGEPGPLSVRYDTLIVAGGSRYSYFGHDEWAQVAPQVKSLESALAVRGRILTAFEAAEMDSDEERRRAWLTFVVVGAGPTGVEMAGQVAELARDTLRRDFRAIDSRNARVLLVEAADRVLTSFPPSLSQKAGRSLEQLGVTPLLNRMVVGIDSESVTVEMRDGGVERIPARTVIWAAGVTASALATQLAEQAGAELDRAGRVAVEPDLTLPGHPEVLALGDMVTRTRRRRHAQGTPRRRTGGHAAGPLRGQARARAVARSEHRPLPLPRQRQPRDDRSRPRGRRSPRDPAERIPRLGGLARGPPLVPDRLPEPSARAHPMVVQLHHPRSRRSGDRPSIPMTLAAKRLGINLLITALPVSWWISAAT